MPVCRIFKITFIIDAIPYFKIKMRLSVPNTAVGNTYVYLIQIVYSKFLINAQRKKK